MQQPGAQEKSWWKQVVRDEDFAFKDRKREGEGQVCQITSEVWQDESDPSCFKVDGKDKSWFMQKGGVMFSSADPAHFSLNVRLLGGELNRYGDDYADLSRADQHEAINWLWMAGVAPESYELTGHKDCKVGGFFFLFHLNYRRTKWRILGCPHNSELEDAAGKLYNCDPQASGQYELPAYEGQTITIEFENGELWIVENGCRMLRGQWSHGDQPADPGKLPDKVYRPVILTANSPTYLQATVTREPVQVCTPKPIAEPAGKSPKGKIAGILE